MNTYITALLEFSLLVGIRPGLPLPDTTMQDILSILQRTLGGEKRCLCTYWKANLITAEIVAGVPIEKHGVGKKFSLAEHPDIKQIAESLFAGPATEVSFNNADPKNHPATAYIKRIEEDPVCIFYHSIRLASAAKDEFSCLIVVVDLLEKRHLGPTEELLCKSVGKLLAALSVSYKNFLETLDLLVREMDLADLRHNLQPLSAIGLAAKRLVTALGSAIEKLGQIPELADAQKFAGIIEKEVLRTEKNLPKHILTSDLEQILH